MKRLTISEGLAAGAGAVAVVASLAGFIPGLYRDPRPVVSQSHGYDIGNLVVVAVLMLGLRASARGSLRGRLVAIGALGCLLYSFVTYSFMIVLNPATLLYIAVLGLGGWSFATGLATIDDREVDAAVHDRLARRTTAGFLTAVAILFGMTWLSQMALSVTSGKLPAELRNIGWPMNPIYVLDLAVIVPLAILAGYRLLRHRPGGARLAVPLLIFVSLLAISVLTMTGSAALDGQPLQAPMILIFSATGSVGIVLARLALNPSPNPLQGWRPRLASLHGH